MNANEKKIVQSMMIAQLFADGEIVEADGLGIVAHDAIWADAVRTVSENGWGPFCAPDDKRLLSACPWYAAYTENDKSGESHFYIVTRDLADAICIAGGTIYDFEDDMFDNAAKTMSEIGIDITHLLLRHCPGDIYEIITKTFGDRMYMSCRAKTEGRHLLSNYDLRTMTFDEAVHFIWSDYGC